MMIIMIMYGVIPINIISVERQRHIAAIPVMINHANKMSMLITLEIPITAPMQVNRRLSSTLVMPM